MSTTAQVMTIEYTTNDKGQKQQIFTTIYETYDTEIFDSVRFKLWCLNYDSGSIFELRGDELKELDIQDFDVNNFVDNEWYRVEIG